MRFEMYHPDSLLSNARTGCLLVALLRVAKSSLQRESEGDQMEGQGGRQSGRLACYPPAPQLANTPQNFAVVSVDFFGSRGVEWI